RGGDVDEVRSGTAVANGLVEPQRSEEVRLEALVDRRIERDLRGAVKDDVEVCRERWRRFGEVALDDLDALVEELDETVVAVLLAEGVERRPLEEGFHSVPPGRAELRPDEEDHLRVGPRGEDLLEHRLTKDA